MSALRFRYRTALEHVICLGVLTAIPMMLILPGILRGSVPVNALSALSYPPWEDARPAGTADYADPTANLEAQRYYPWYAFLGSAQRLTDVLWDPLEFTGQPFFAVWRTRCLSPFSLPFYLADTRDALRLSFFLKMCIAGMGAFYVAWRLGMRPALAMIPALTFQLSGPILVWHVLPISDVVVWFPFLLLFAERLALGQYRVWPGGASVMALMLLGGEPEAFVVLLAVALVYFFFRVPGEWHGFSGAGAALFFLGASVALAIGLVSVQLLPYREFLHYASDQGLPALRYNPNRFDLAAWVLPYVSTNPAEMQPGATVASHSGLILLLLLPVWLSLRPFAEARTRRRCEALLLPVVAFNVLAHFWMGVRGALPFGSAIAPEHLFAANGFSLGVIGALTGDEWLRLGPDEIKSTLKRLAIFGPLSIAAVLAAIVWPGGHAGLVPGPWWPAMLVFVFTLAAICVLGITAVRPSIRVLGYSLAALIAIDLAITFVPRMPSTPGALLFPETQFISLLKKTGGRVTGSSALSDWPLAANGIPQIYGSSGVIYKHQADYRARVADDPLLLKRSGTPLLLLTQEDIQGKFAPLREKLRIEQVLPAGAILFYDTGASGRVWMAYEARNVEKYNPAEVTSTAPVLVEQGVPPPPLPPDKNPGSAVIEPGETNTRVAVKLDGVSRGILVLADAFFPGWRATVDGKPARVLAMDLLYRGVEVPENAKEVVFEYAPPLVKVGLTVTGVSVLILLVSLVITLSRSIRHIRERDSWIV